MNHTLLKLTIPMLCSVLMFGSAQAQTATEADTITVQQGDTAYSLARRAGLSVEDLLTLNNLTTPTLKIGQILILRSTTAHQVQAGETLYALSRKYGVTVDALKAANDLPADAVIAVGQTLRIPGTGQVAASAPAKAVAAPVAPVAQDPAPQVAQEALNAAATTAPDFQGGSWRDKAFALMNTPYVWGGQNRTGTDCSGFVLQVFSPLGVKLPRQSADQARAGVAVDINELQAGDLIFFDTVGGGKVTHVGIYLGNDSFINANSYRGKVTVDRLRADKYWATRFMNARRVLPSSIMANQP